MGKPLQKQVAERISAILEEKGMRQKDLVEATGMTKSYISQIIHGTVNLTLETIEIIEKALKSPIIHIGK